MNVTLTGGSISGYEIGLFVTNEANVNGVLTPAGDSAERQPQRRVDDDGRRRGRGACAGCGRQHGRQGGMNNTTINAASSGTGVRLDGTLAALTGDTLGNTAFTGFAGSSNYVALANATYANDEIDGTGAFVQRHGWWKQRHRRARLGDRRPHGSSHRQRDSGSRSACAVATCI